MSAATYAVCTWCEGLVELSAPVQAAEVAVAVWCAACRDIVPAYVLGGHKAACAARTAGLGGREAMPLGCPLDDADN